MTDLQNSKNFLINIDESTNFFMNSVDIGSKGKKFI